MDGDGNLAALARYEREQEEAERRYERFVDTVLVAIQDDYEDLKSQYDSIAKDFGCETTSFEEFVRENI